MDTVQTYKARDTIDVVSKKVNIPENISSKHTLISFSSGTLSRWGQINLSCAYIAVTGPGGSTPPGINNPVVDSYQDGHNHFRIRHSHDFGLRTQQRRRGDVQRDRHSPTIKLVGSMH